MRRNGYSTWRLIYDEMSRLPPQEKPEDLEKIGFFFLKARIDRLEQGIWQFGCLGDHRGVGTEDCPRGRHHHHDVFCAPVTKAELILAGISPKKFKENSRR